MKTVGQGHNQPQKKQKTKILMHPQIKKDEPVLVNEQEYIVQDIKETQKETQIQIQKTDIIADNDTKLIDDNTLIGNSDEKEKIPFEGLMDTLIKEESNTIHFGITLTKKQYEAWLKKGGVKWLKKALAGQISMMSRARKKTR